MKLKDGAVLPNHIALIMDGNNRYAKAHHLSVGSGHLEGKNALDPIVRHCQGIGVRALTVFAFSSENFSRPADEVAALMQLLEDSIKEQIDSFEDSKVCLRFIGERSKLPTHLLTLMDEAVAKSAHFFDNPNCLILTIALAYGGKWDVVQACRNLAKKAQSGVINIDSIDEAMVNAELSLADLPPLDMMIRTGGDVRLSNFLLWQAAYAELFFTDTLWPNFSVDELQKMLNEFSLRERRFGGKGGASVLGASDSDVHNHHTPNEHVPNSNAHEIDACHHHTPNKVDLA